MDFSRLRVGEIIAGIAGIALFVFMFFDWFEGGATSIDVETQEIPGIGEVPTGGGTVATTEGVNAWDSLQDFSGFLIALAALFGVTLAGLAVTGRRLNLGGIPRGAGTLVLGKLAIALILWRMLANPGDLEFGIFLGLAAAIGIATGAALALREGGFEPLVAVAGGRTRSSAAAPATRRRAASRSSRSRSTASRSGGGRATGTRAKGAGKGRSSSARSKSSGSRSSSSRSRSSSTRSSSARKKK